MAFKKVLEFQRERRDGTLDRRAEQQQRLQQTENAEDAISRTLDQAIEKAQQQDFKRECREMVLRAIVAVSAIGVWKAAEWVTWSVS